MAISIDDAIASPNTIPDQQTIIVTVSFEGIALIDNTKVIVEFNLAPYPELTFSGERVVTAPFIFNQKQDTFTKTLHITNNTPTSPVWINALIGLTAKEYGTVWEDSTSAAIVYR